MYFTSCTSDLNSNDAEFEKHEKSLHTAEFEKLEKSSHTATEEGSGRNENNYIWS